MKKLMIALAVAAMAVASQAASFKWTTTGDVLGVSLSSLNGNGSYSAAGDVLNKNCTLTAVLTIYAAGTETVIGTGTKSVTFAYGKNTIQSIINVTGNIEKSTMYDYVLNVTGTQTDMLSHESDKWDYSSAKIAWTGSGSVTSATMAQTALETAAPATWTVSGATQQEEPTPEPTSGLLMLLGMAGLALRRKQK